MGTVPNPDRKIEKLAELVLADLEQLRKTLGQVAEQLAAMSISLIALKEQLTPGQDEYRGRPQATS